MAKIIFVPRVWLYKKPHTSHGLVVIQVGRDVMWAKTMEDNVISEYKKDTLAGFCQMKANEGYVPDENTFFTFTSNGVAEIIRSEPCDELN